MAWVIAKTTVLQYENLLNSIVGKVCDLHRNICWKRFNGLFSPGANCTTMIINNIRTS